MHYDPDLPVEFTLSVDVSPYGLGTVIMHVYPNGTRRPIAYASRTLNEHEKCYGQIDKEALAIMFALVPVWSTFHDSNGSQTTGTYLWDKDGDSVPGGYASTAIGNYSCSLQLQH